MKTMYLPSGQQDGAIFAIGPVVSCFEFLPSGVVTQRSSLPPAADVYRILPSAVHEMPHNPSKLPVPNVIRLGSGFSLERIHKLEACSSRTLTMLESALRLNPL